MENVLWYKTPASYFEEAFPMGNGFIGATVYGKADKEKISLNHDTLWSGKPSIYERPAAYEAYTKAQKLVLEGRVTEAEEILVEDFNGRDSEMYLPMGNLHIECGKGEISDYKRRLDLETGTAHVSFKKGGKDVSREYFVSAPDSCIAMRFETDFCENYSLCFESVLKYAAITDDSRIIIDGECPSAVNTKENVLSYDGGSIKFTSVIEINTDGCVSSYSVKNARFLELVIHIETSFISYDKPPTRDCRRACLEQRADSFAEIKARHIQDFSSFYNRQILDLNMPSSPLPTDERLRFFDAGLAELRFNFGRYLIISSSRAGSRATNLQGIWNEKLPAPWRSNYTMNINTEMNYWPVLPGGLPEFFEPLADLAEKLCQCGAHTARHFYNAEGSTSHHTSDLWGMTNSMGIHVPGTCGHSYWNMTLAWMACMLFEYYEYTLDENFLRGRAFPVIKACIDFYLSVLTEYEGRLIVTPSTSPENRYFLNGERVGLAKWTTMTQSILIDLFGKGVKCCEALGLDTEYKSTLEKTLPLLDTFESGSRGQLLEWDAEYEECDPHHRHVSHLYALYPGDIITHEKNSHLLKACENSLEIRGDAGTGWSLAWKINLWARLRDGNRAFTVAKRGFTLKECDSEMNYMGSGGIYPNLLDAHPPFQIDGNFGYVSGIIQMLIQCEDGKIILLPALPDDFPSGSAKGLAAKGRVSVDLRWEDCKVKEASLISPISQTVRLEINSEATEIRLSAGKPHTIHT